MHSSLCSIVALLAASCHGINTMSLSDDVTDLGNGVVMENNATHATAIVNMLYPDVVRPIPDTNFAFSHGAVTFAGYYSLLGGSGTINDAVDSCKGLNGIADGIQCANNGLSALVAHSLAFLAGAAYGLGTVAYIADVARQATGFPSPNARRLGRRSCPAVSPITTNSYWPGGTAGVKLTAETACVHIPSGPLSDIQALSGNIVSNMVQNSAWQLQGTYYDIASSQTETQVLLRTAMYILGQAPSPCPNQILGTGCSF